MSADYLATLPADMQMKLRKAAWEQLGLKVVPDRETALRVLALESLFADVLELHAEWLQGARGEVLDRGES